MVLAVAEEEVITAVGSVKDVARTNHLKSAG
jgi:hypothetical protein